MSKLMMFLLFFIIAVVYVLLNLGNFIDVTKEPREADIVVSLGGDYSGCRLRKAVSIYKNGFSKSKIFIYTGADMTENSFDGIDSRRQYILNQNIKNENIIHVSKKIISNTMEEILFIKKYMLFNGYKSVLFVSHPQHSRRISTLANLIANYKGADLSLSVASCNPSWWKKNLYYTDKTSFTVTMHEMVKLFYNLFKYNPLLIEFTSYKKNNKNILWNNYLQKNEN